VTRASDYSRADVVAALRAVGVRPGDTVFSHTSVGMLGLPAEGLDRQAVTDLFYSAFFEVLGSDGTWILPAYTYSYTAGEPFDPRSTPPRNMGVLPEMLWRHPDARRSLDPIFSVIAFGGHADEIAASSSTDCFGVDSVYAKLIAMDAAVCNVGLGSHAALLHHVEQVLGVPYRYIKVFDGTTVDDNGERQSSVRYNVRSLDNPRHAAYFMRLDRDGRADGSIGSVRVGRGEINLIRARRMAELAHEGIARDPEYLVVGDLAGLAVA
jgi:aminoglycoside 3-N-acetyltransferase